MTQITDPEVELLAQCSLSLQGDYPNEATNSEDWKRSPFGWFQQGAPARKGAIGKKLISRYLRRKGFRVTDFRGRDADRNISGKRASIKTSFLWEGGIYTFEQIRDRNYDFLLCLGINPFNAHCWVFPKQIVMDKWHDETITEIRSQHGDDDAWMQINPLFSSNWIKESGGTLSQAIGKIIEITGQKPLP